MSEPARLMHLDAKRFREVLGNYPTGVAVVTATGLDGRPVGMAVGSFTSVSLDPPLVAFFPDKSSSTFPKIREAGCFCVNVLAATQEIVCRAFAAKSEDKFQGIGWQPAGSGSPVLNDVVAWIDCDIETITEAGDHYIVVGRVRELDVASPSFPLLFFRGGYGLFSSRSRVAPVEPDLVLLIRLVDAARSEMERVASDLGLECTATGVVGDELVVLASAGTPSRDDSPSMVGRRLPMVPPMGSQFMAWESQEIIEEWFGRSPTPLDNEKRAAYNEALDRARRRGWMLYTSDSGFAHINALLEQTLGEGPNSELEHQVYDAITRLGVGFGVEDLAAGQEYDVRRIVAPVFGLDGKVVLTLNALNPSYPCTLPDIDAIRQRLLVGAGAVTRAIGGRPPG